jgi:hypothetical protein
MYYLRTQAARDPIKFTVDPSKINNKDKKEELKKPEGDKEKTELKTENPSANNIHVIDDDDPGLCLSCGA